MSTEIQIQHYIQNGIYIIQASGEFDETNVDKSFDEIRDFIKPTEEKKCVIFDLGNVTYVNSKFIGFTAEISNQLEENGGRITLVNTKNISDTLEICGIQQIIEIFPTIEEGKAYLQEMYGDFLKQQEEKIENIRQQNQEANEQKKVEVQSFFGSVETPEQEINEDPAMETPAMETPAMEDREQETFIEPETIQEPEIEIQNKLAEEQQSYINDSSEAELPEIGIEETELEKTDWFDSETQEAIQETYPTNASETNTEEVGTQEIEPETASGLTLDKQKQEEIIQESTQTEEIQPEMASVSETDPEDSFSLLPHLGSAPEQEESEKMNISDENSTPESMSFFTDTNSEATESLEEVSEPQIEIPHMGTPEETEEQEETTHNEPLPQMQAEENTTNTFKQEENELDAIQQELSEIQSMMEELREKGIELYRKQQELSKKTNG